MQDKITMAKIIAFILITFVFVFMLFTGYIPILPMSFENKPKVVQNNPNTIAEDKQSKQNDSKESKGIIPPTVNNRKEEKVLNSTEIRKNLIGTWQLAEITSEGRTVKIDTTKKVAPDEFVVYKFYDNKIDVFWENEKIVLTYKWIGENEIESIQTGTKPGEPEYKELATLRIDEGKLYMSSTTADSSKSEGVFIRYTGKLPNVVSE